MPCSLCDKLKALFRLGLRMSSPTITIFFPNKARLTARLEAIKVLPSPVVVEVTNITFNLAVSLALLGKKIVIVGLDIRKPGLNKAFMMLCIQAAFFRFALRRQACQRASSIWMTRRSEWSLSILKMPAW